MVACHADQSQRKLRSHLAGTQIGKKSALPAMRIVTSLAMFKITRNTVHHFTLAELLLMAAMNQLEAERKVGSAARSRCEGINLGVGDGR
jgi:hypothetical protein